MTTFPPNLTSLSLSFTSALRHPLTTLPPHLIDLSLNFTHYPTDCQISCLPAKLTKLIIIFSREKNDFFLRGMEKRKRSTLCILNSICYVYFVFFSSCFFDCYRQRNTFVFCPSSQSARSSVIYAPCLHATCSCTFKETLQSFLGFCPIRFTPIFHISQLSFSLC
jgi:hypothetical protein